jgi:glutaredoxin
MRDKKRKVIVYTGAWCPWCQVLVDFLKKNKVKFVSRDVDNPKYALEAMKKSGQAGIPISDIDGKIVIGFDETRLRHALTIK